MSIPKRNQSLSQRSWSFPNAPAPECNNARKRSNTAAAYVLPPSRSSSLNTDYFHKKKETSNNNSLLPLPHDKSNQELDLEDEEASSLLEWKRQSILIRSSVILPDMTEDEDEDDACQDMANKLWRGDKVPEASFLGSLDPFSQCTLELYLAKYDFTGMRLDEAFRKLCQKVYFKAEAQEIDRILEAFAHRYWACNDVNALFGSADVVYAIIYSLMLLNTDLHIARGHTRMSRIAFCKNTMETIRNFASKEMNMKYETEEVEALLKELYNSVKQHGFMQPQQQQQTSINNNNTIQRTLLRRFNSLTQKEKPHHHNNHHHNAIMYMQQFQTTPDDKSFIYLEGKMLCKPVPPPSSSSSSSSSSRRNANYNNNNNNHHYHYYNKRNNSKRNNKNQYHERYRECWVSLGPGYLQIDQHYGARLGTKSSCHELFHAFAMPHAPSWHRNGPSPFGFLLQLPNHHGYIFSCDSKNQVITWVRLCNYWAARQSKIPLMSNVGISHHTIYYGWEPDVINAKVSLETIEIRDWHPPLLHEQQQQQHGTSKNVDALYDSFQRYRDTLRVERERHVAVFDPMDQAISPTMKWEQVHTNWTTKKGFLDLQLQKYNAYLNAIQEQRRMPFNTNGLYDQTSNWLSEMDLLKEISDALTSNGSEPLLFQ